MNRHPELLVLTGAEKLTRKADEDHSYEIMTNKMHSNISLFYLMGKAGDDS